VRDDESDEIQDAFGEVAIGFPTERRSFNYKREIDKQSEDKKINQWFEANKITIGLTNEEEQKKAKRLLYTWRDLFCNAVRDLQQTDLMSHKIPTWRDTIPVRAKEKLYTPEEINWQKEIFQNDRSWNIGLL
jgi:hypothetical protein